VKSKKWLDGKNIPMWPEDGNIGWVVQTAGLVDLDDIYPMSGDYNYGTRRKLPAGTRAILKHIDEKNNAFIYNDNGVMMMPVELLEPVEK
jgi:hypothetical protein